MTAAPITTPAHDIGRIRPADVPRLAQVALTVSRNGLVAAGHRPASLARRPHHALPRSASVALRRSFTDLGPTTVKFGQLIASSPGLFPDLLATEMRRLLDAVPPEPPDRIRRVVERSLDASISTLFTSFDDEPIASASIAQVHRAVLPDGTAVAVKVRRPHLRDRIEQDLRVLRTAAGLLAQAGPLGATLNPVAVIEDLAHTLRSELDFRIEAQTMADYADVLALLDPPTTCHVPTPIGGMVTERVLVMSFVDGTPIDDVEPLREAGHDLEQLLRDGVRTWVGAALEHGIFHGDVHAGNLFVTPAGELTFLDFGIAGRLDDRTRLILRRALPAVLVDGDYATVVNAVFELGAATGPVDIDAATADVARLLEPMVDKPLAEISYGELLGHILQVATRYRVVLPRAMVLVVKQLLYFERYAKLLAPDYRMLADPSILQHIIGPARHVERPVLRTRPRSHDLDTPGGGLRVERQGQVQFSWQYTDGRSDLLKLYDKAKRAQWNVTTDLDWSIDVDPLDTGGLASYLPMIAADSFQRFDERERAEAGRQFNAWITSQFLHGEQGALLATSKLVKEVPWTEAKYYGATQVYDEARHVEAYARYLDEKLELTYPVNDNLRQLLELVVADPRWDITYLGMQIVVEGIALAAFGLIHQFSTEPLIKQITRYVMADEARHVAFGALSLAGIYDEMTAAERAERHDFVVEAAWLMRDRFLATEVWERLGIPLDDGLRDSANSPMLQLFQRVLFAKITPNLRKIGLLDAALTDRLITIGAMAPDDL
jgi:predicted unusual protein kinase regulating ubiquinone biosynthesis (AarF/ABC1/UbiB family)